MGKVYRYGYDETHRLDTTSLYALLRSEEPVARVTTPYGDDGWLVTRHDSVKTVLHDPRLSRAAAIEVHDRLPRASAHVPKVNLISKYDPPEHSRLRQLVAGAFTKHKAQQHRPQAEEIANELVDELISTGPPARTRNRHVAFGFGTHHCPAAALSRMQLQVAFTTVLDRFPHLELAIPDDEMPWKTGHVTRGPERLPVKW